MKNKYITLAKLSIVTTAISLAALLALHFLSPEFSPSWRMVSEYAKGNYEWVLIIFFLSGGVSTWCMAFSTWGVIQNTWSRIGVALLFISGIGGVMASIFNVTHPLHGTAALLGIPTFLLASLMISFNLRKRYPFNHKRLVWATTFVWVSMVLMVVAMVVMMSGLKKAGVANPGTIDVAKTNPAGVIALVGYANRLFVLTNSYWSLLVCSECIKILKAKNKNDKQYNYDQQGSAKQKITGNKTI